MENYSEKDKKFLLEFARQTLTAYLTNKSVIDLPKVSDKLLQKRGVFVTLTKNNELRGCIGNIEPIYPLIKGVQQNVIAAATEDPRFLPVELNELNDLKIEISILTEPQETKLEDIRIGTDGVILKYGSYQATYLPQVWEYFNNNRDKFFSNLAQKAGLAASDYLNPKIKFFKYQAIVFSE